MELAAIQAIVTSDAFREYVKTLPIIGGKPYVEGEAEESGGKDTISWGVLFPSLNDPGAVWGQTDDGSWGRVEGAINWTPFSNNFHRLYNGVIGIGVDIDYTVSAYQSYKEYIQNNFTGEERDEYMAKLHELVAQVIEHIAGAFANDVGNFFEKHSVAGEKDLLKESLLAWFNESLSAKSGVSLVDFGMSVPENESGNLYSKDEIYAMGYMMLATGAAGDLGPRTFTHKDYPAMFINAAIQMESIYNAFSVRDSLKDKFETILFDKINKTLDVANENFAKQREIISAYGGTEQALARWAPIDKESILQITKNVLEDLRNGLSAMDVIMKAGYLDTFFKDLGFGDPKLMTYSIGVQTLADDFNWFSAQMSSIKQRSANIDWKNTGGWNVWG